MYGAAMFGRAVVAAIAVVAMAGPAVAADAVDAHIGAGARAYQAGDAARAAHELQAALLELQTRLSRSLSADMPPPPSGWQAEEPEMDGLGAVGGGLSVTRAYTKGESSLNASIILDSPAVEAAASQMANPVAQPGLKRVKAGAEDALLRWDDSAKSGEITMVIAGRVLLQIEGDGLAGSDVLMDAAKGFNVAAIRKLIGA